MVAGRSWWPKPGALLLFKMADSELTTVGNYILLAEAELAQSFLDNNGIESVIIDDNMGRMLGWNVVGGFKLQVKKQDSDTALRLLAAPHGNQAAQLGIPLLRCPNCDSFEIAAQENDNSFHERDSLPRAVEIEPQRTSWKCKSCGYSWESPEMHDGRHER